MVMSQISKKELIDLLGKLVSYNTVNIPSENVKAPKECPEFIVKHLQEKGIDAKMFEDEGYYSVYGEVGEGKFNLLLMAHFDVVPVSDGWDTDPFEMVIKDEKTAYGHSFDLSALFYFQLPAG